MNWWDFDSGIDLFSFYDLYWWCKPKILILHSITYVSTIYFLHKMFILTIKDHVCNFFNGSSEYRNNSYVEFIRGSFTRPLDTIFWDRPRLVSKIKWTLVSRQNLFTPQQKKRIYYTLSVQSNKHIRMNNPYMF